MEDRLVRKALQIAFLCAGTAFCEQVAVSQFIGLNTNESSVIIGPEYSQDTLNTEVTPGGKSVKKRSGFGTYKDVGIGAVHGGHHFFDSTGNDVQVWGSSVSLWGIVADGTPTQLVSSATLNTTWDCEDIQASAYCVNSSRNALIKTDGATMTWFSSALGTIVASTPDRLVVAGIAGAPSSLYVSESNNFANFTVANLTSSPFVEPIAASGSKLTHIRWGCGKLLWWKDQSFGYTNFEDQFILENKIVSNTIGTFDNASAVDPGGNVWFRGQDGHIWRYDCSGLTKESIEITPNIQVSGRRTSNSVAYDSQTDFQTGTSSATSTLSTTISAGSIVPSSFTKTENSSASGWGSGTASNLSVGTSSISLTLNNTNLPNNGFETGDFTNWTNLGGSAVDITTTFTGDACTISPRTGSYFFRDIGGGSGTGYTATVYLKTCSGTTLSSVNITHVNNSCTWTSRTLSSAGQAGKLSKILIDGAVIDIIESDCFVNSGTDITFYTASDRKSPPVVQQSVMAFDDFTNGRNTITSGNFTSQAIHTGLPYSHVFASATWTANTSTPSFVLQKSANGTSDWTDVTTSTGGNSQVNVPYIRYLSTFTFSSTDNALSALKGVQLIARSSGTWFSAVKNAPNLAAWSTFNPTWTDNGDDINFFVRSSTSPFYVLNSSPPWTALTAGSLVSGSTGTYFQVIASFTVTAATNTTSSLNNFTVNWFEGSASDQAYMHYFDNAIWSSVAFGVGVSSNTHIFRRDLINDGWTVYSFGAGGMLTQNNRLYFGDVGLGGNVFIYGSGTSDNGSAINAYWKTKDFTGPDPFLESALTQIDTFAKKDANQNLTTTYTMNTSTATSFTISLSSNTQTIIQNRKFLPAGKTGFTFNVKYGDNTTSSAWEILGFRIGFNTLSYRPGN